MEVVMLCGGKGMRMRPHTENIPKPMMSVGDMPIMEHLMKYFLYFGHTKFIACLGYRKEAIESYFNNSEWDIKLVDTGEETSKSERLKKIAELIKGDSFFLSYGDDLSTVNLEDLYAFHKKNNALVTVTAVRLVSPYGIIKMDSRGKIIDFKEKPVLDHYINGGFFVMDKSVLNMMKDGDDLEKDVLPRIAAMGRLYAFRHDGFWASMNTHQDNIMLNDLWSKGKAEWKIWKA
ncbi:MAG: glucose-1-phosphate cytidylyltransferase [Candidatus Aenigmarchaeota archaeon]|nr:glucose-1-phosphate cytidylyltransferase [Candidatus Aenigmarchaeota archaeon]